MREVDRDRDRAPGVGAPAPSHERAHQEHPRQDHGDPGARHDQTAWRAIPRRVAAATNASTTIASTPTHATGHAAGRDGVIGAYPAATGSGCPYPLASIARSFVSVLAGVSIVRYVSHA